MRHRGALLLAALAYLPTLASSPGRMPADTKLYLYLDPGRLIRDAPQSWDNRQFLGWVPHQMISYLWPSGPWFWVFDKLGVPDWVAHRLWLGTLLFLGGLGVRWAARHLGLGGPGPLVAGLVYMLSPYILPYVSRTSLMLLPWAAVGWITGLAVRAARRGGWRDPALIALIVLTIGAVNPTALAFIVPAPVLWLVHSAWQRSITWRHATVTALRVGILSAVVSLWWIAMSSVQSRYGAAVLSYSESLDAVSHTSVSTETLRGLGYWLFYVRDPYGFTTTSSAEYMASGRVIAVGFALLVVCLAGIACVRWAARRFAAMLVFCGIVLAVGVHPIDDPAPAVEPLASSGLSLALRSSTRAIPLSSFGFALGAGALVVAVRRWSAQSAATPEAPRRSRSWRHRWLGVAVPVAVGALAVLNLPSLWHRSFVDPVLARDEDPPAAWQQATAALDRSDLEARVLQLPGQEFGAFRWGYTVDPPLPGLTKKAVATRDLLPLGSPGAMDLLYALDDRVQDSTVDPASIAPVARLLGADTIWLSNDIAFDRFRTARSEPLAETFAAGVPGIGPITSFGTPQPNVPVLPMVDAAALADPSVGEALPPVQLAAVQQPTQVVRAASDVVVLSGSGDGMVEAAGAGLLHGDEAVLYAADLTAADDLASAAQLIVTDSNRVRAHEWRGSQDAVGFTEAGGPDGGLLRGDDADERLPVFDQPATDTAGRTTASLETGLVIRATGYGEPAAYRPEQRPAMAVDGNPETAWVVGDRSNPIGEALEVSAIGGTLTLLAPQHTTANRMVTGVRVEPVDGSSPAVDVDLDDRTLTAPGQTLTGLPKGAVTITITSVGPRPGGTDTGPSAVGFAELGLGTNREIVHVPTDVLGRAPQSTPLAIVLARERTDPSDRWRSDPEPALVRDLTLPAARSMDAQVTLRLDRRADDAVLARLTGHDEVIADRRLTGTVDAAGWHAVDGNPGTAWTSPFGVATGSTLTVRLDPTLSTGPLTIHQPLDDVHSLIAAVTVAVGDRTVDLVVPPPDAAGASSIELPAVQASSMTITVTGTTARTTIDRRYGEPTDLPVAITELDEAALDRTPTTLPAAPACRDDLLTIDGRPQPLAIGDDEIAHLVAGGTVTVGACEGSSFDLSAGRHVIATAVGLQTGIDVDRIVLANGVVRARSAAPAVEVQRTRDTRTATVAPCPTGCWLILGEGYDTGWIARSGGRSLGSPRQISGGFNGWWIGPTDSATTVEMSWTPQRTVNVALGLSALGAALCLLLVWRSRPGRAPQQPTGPAFFAPWKGRATSRSAVVSAVVLTATSALTISWTFGLVGLVLGAAIVTTRRTRLPGLAAVVLAAVLGLIVFAREITNRYFVNAGWPDHFEDLHRFGLLVVALLLAGAIVDDADTPMTEARPTTGTSGS